MTTTRTFDIGDILSVTTEKLVSRRHVGGLYDLLGFMTGEDLFTHQLPRANDMCAPALLAQHPWAEGVDLPDPPHGGWTEETVYAWLDEMAARHGAAHEVAPLPPEDRRPQDPIEELCDMVGAEKVYVVTPPTQGQAP